MRYPQEHPEQLLKKVQPRQGRSSTPRVLTSTMSPSASLTPQTRSTGSNSSTSNKHAFCSTPARNNAPHPHQAKNGAATAAPRSTMASMASRDYPRIPWLHECWSRIDNRYERIATGSPLSSIAMLSQILVQHHINMLPTLDSVSDFLAIYNHKGRYLGSRPKLATWPLTERDAAKNKVWSA